MRRARRWLVVVAVPGILAGGCYRYVPVATPQQGMDVRAQLTSEAAVRRSQGREEPVMRYDGVIVGATPDSLALDVLVARASSGLQEVVIRDTVNLATAELQTVLQRKLSAPRTALATLVAGAGIVAVVMSVEGIVGGTDDPPDNGTPNVRFPVSWQLLRLLLGHH